MALGTNEVLFIYARLTTFMVQKFSKTYQFIQVIIMRLR